MSVTKEASGRRWVQVEVEVPGTPEEVWQAIATGPGVSSWFVPTEIREDGTVVSNFGPGMDAIATRTAWEPPHRFAAESSGLGPGAPALATEWIVEARAGGTCLVRVVHSLFASTDDWDNQLTSVESGWPWYFQILRLYLTHFRGERCSAFRVMGFVPGPAAETWAKIIGSLGLDEASIGERCRSGAGAPVLSGIVEQTGRGAHPHGLMIRVDDPAPGVVSMFALGMGGQTCVMICFFLYGEKAPHAVEQHESTWQEWMNQQFPAPAVPSMTGCAPTNS